LTDDQRKFMKKSGILAASYMLPMHYYFPERGVPVDARSETVQEMITLGLIRHVSDKNYTVTPEGSEALDAHFKR